jgi:hypothetical protein
MEFDLTDVDGSYDEAADAVALIEAMVAWFSTTYEDPVHSLPFVSNEGGYQAYAEKYGASALVTYTQVEAARAFSEHQHAGPWVGDGWDTELLNLDPRWAGDAFATLLSNRRG